MGSVASVSSPEGRTPLSVTDSSCMDTVGCYLYFHALNRCAAVSNTVTNAVEDTTWIWLLFGSHAKTGSYDYFLYTEKFSISSKKEIQREQT